MKKKILLQIDHDAVASSFDSIVAIESGVDHILPYPNMTPIQMEPIVHGAIFTRGVKNLHQTAMFFGGSNVDKTTELFAQAKKCFFGPLRVSMMTDPNGSNTTAAAAVLCAQQHGPLTGKKVAVLAGTGPVGRRISQLVAAAGATVLVGSRDRSRAQRVCKEIEAITGNRLQAFEAGVPRVAADMVADSQIVFAAGAAGIELLAKDWLQSNQSAEVAIDINAVPPYGIGGLEATDEGQERFGTICYGAIGVGGLKMKIHKRAIQQLFESKELELDIQEIYEIGQALIDQE